MASIESKEVPAVDAVPRGQWTADRSAVQAGDDLKVTVAVLVFYLIDAALLAAFCLVAGARWATPIAFATVGILVSAASIAHHRRNRHGARLDSPGVVMLQVIAALLLTLGVIATDTAVVVPMLMIQIVMLSTAAVRLRPGQVLLLCIATAVATTGLLVHAAAPIAVVAGSLGQQVLLGLWLLWTLAKGATTNLAGMAMRLEIAASHEQLAAALDRVKVLAERDELTGLFNRRRVLEMLANERDRCRRTGLKFSVAMLDIDHFKQINDRFGHPVGDEVLRAVAELMSRILWNRDIVGRLGGEEFLLVLPGARDANEARTVAERVRRAIEEQDWSRVHPGLQVTASLGVTTSGVGDTAEALLERSDQCLYDAKHAGRNRVEVSLSHTTVPRPGAGAGPRTASWPAAAA